MSGSAIIRPRESGVVNGYRKSKRTCANLARRVVATERLKQCVYKTQEMTC
jgi:hypothetical protein